MPYKVTSKLSTWIMIDGKQINHGESIIVETVSSELRHLETKTKGALQITEVDVVGSQPDVVIAPTAAETKSDTKLKVEK